MSSSKQLKGEKGEPVWAPGVGRGEEDFWQGGSVMQPGALAVPIDRTGWARGLVKRGGT